MIIVNLKGGLGNQMFQYACGRALFLRNAAKDTNGFAEYTGPKLDCTGFASAMKSDTPRKYELDGWDIVADTAWPNEIRKVKYPFGIFSKAARFFRAKVLKRYYINFVPSVLSLSGDVYLDGFFQDERYFKDFADDIRLAFTPKNPLSPKSQAWINRIYSDESSVSLHVRRGDYTTTASAEFVSLEPSYYASALAHIRTLVPNPHVYVFSDDIAWAKANIALPSDAEFVSDPKTPLFEEIFLMSACRHNIIANSSFSWWGAWLNANPDKVVVAPKAWAKRHESWYKDIIPPTWIRL
ncbi:MAG: alpha-1,2-fucosyltransferase [bacterium]|nr:alpha-1,2-fucosyltransferase [bacterium]